MRRFAGTLAILTLGVCEVATADVFKCMTHDGRISFASTPCPDYVGETLPLRPAPSRLSSDWEEPDFPHRVNKNATEILQVSRRRKIIITNEKKSPTTCRPFGPLPRRSIDLCRAKL